MPLVSVVIPTFNRLYLLPRSIGSVQRQTLTDIELLVVDDGGGLVTEENLPATRFPIRIIRKPNGGPGSARNAGWREADSLYVAYLDDDDEWSPDHLEILVAALRESSERRIAYSTANVVEHGAHVRWWGGESFNKFICDGFYTIFPPSSCLHCRNLFEETGAFDEEPLMIGPDDCELTVRISDRTTPYATHQATVVMHRDESLTRNPRPTWVDALHYAMNKNGYYSTRRNWLMYYRAYIAALREQRQDHLDHWQCLLENHLPAGTRRYGMALRGAVNIDPDGIKAYCRMVLAATSNI